MLAGAGATSLLQKVNHIGQSIEQTLGLSTLARPRRPQQDQFHPRRPLSFDFFSRPSY